MRRNPGRVVGTETAGGRAMIRRIGPEADDSEE